MQRPAPRIRHYVEAAALYALQGVLYLFPRRWVHLPGTLLGMFLFHVVRLKRDLTLRHLQVALGDSLTPDRRREVAARDREGVRIRVIGDRKALAPDIQRLISDAETRTEGNRRLTLTVALNYGSRAEIVRAARRMAEKVERGEIAAAEIDERALESELYTAGLPDPDLLIRTSGEQRVSNFLLWQLAYTEFVFLDVYWPDFSKAAFIDAVRIYQRRERRYGAFVA